MAGTAAASHGRLDPGNNASIVRGGSRATPTARARDGCSGDPFAGETTGSLAADPRRPRPPGVILNSADGTTRPYGVEATPGPVDGRTPSAADVPVTHTCRWSGSSDGPA